MVNKDIYRVVNTRTNKAVIVNGETSPAFEYPQQALNYIDKIIGPSPYVGIKKVKNNNR